MECNKQRRGLFPGLLFRAFGAFRGYFLFFLCALCVLCGENPAWARSWHVTDFHDNIVIGRDGSALVEEQITVAFTGHFQGIHREIPLEYPGPYGSNYSLFLTVQAVTDENGSPLKYEAVRQDVRERLTIYVPGAEDATRTVRIAYSVPNAIRYFPGYDELYWNVTGNDWPVPIDHASAIVSFPPDAAGNLRVQAFTGAYGSREQEAGGSVEGTVATFETTNPLAMRGGLTVDVYISKGILQPPSLGTRVSWFLRANPIVFLPVVALLVMGVMWWFKGRDPDPGQSVAPMYEPPAGLSPAECGTLLADSVEPRDVTATVVDLAVRGYLKIEETEDKHLLWSNKDYVFHRLKDDGPDLRAFERVVLSHMFDGGSSIRMSELKNHFYVAVPVMKQDILAALKAKSMYSVDPESAGGYVLAAALLIGGPFVLLQVFHLADFFLSLPMALLGIALAAVIVILFGRQMTAKSLLGVRTRVRILGFQEFMKRVDADRLKQMPPDTFEKYLPYAMALGVEHGWALAFKDLLREPPQWYTGPAYPGMMWNPILFSNQMHTMATDLHSVMIAAPRSSSTGSGFSGGFGGGGGFSGGGFGGGGGGAF